MQSVAKIDRFIITSTSRDHIKKHKIRHFYPFINLDFITEKI